MSWKKVKEFIHEHKKHLVSSWSPLERFQEVLFWRFGQMGRGDDFKGRIDSRWSHWCLELKVQLVLRLLHVVSLETMNPVIAQMDSGVMLSWWLLILPERQMCASYSRGCLMCELKRTHTHTQMSANVETNWWWRASLKAMHVFVRGNLRTGLISDCLCLGSLSGPLWFIL